MAEPGIRGARWFLVLFGLPFAGVGVGVFGWLLLPVLLDWHAAQSWQPLSAEVLTATVVEHRDDDSVTWQATARFRYEVDGRSYEGERVAIDGSADNIGDFQQRLGGELAEAFARGGPVTVYVDPADPARAVYNRELRTGKVALMAVFALVFGVAGFALVAAGLLVKGGATGVSAPAEPWRERADWSSPEVRSNARARVLVAWFFTFIWWAISGVATLFAWDAFVREGNNAALVVLLFDIVGAGLLWWAVVATLGARRYGNLTVRLDPHPGAIGGDTGGVVDLRLPADAIVTMALSCLHVYTRRTNKGSETRRDPVWSDTRHFFGEPLGDGTLRVYFRFPVPAGLPASTPPSSDHYVWSLHLAADVPGVDLSRDIEIPVFATGKSSGVAARVRESQAESLAHLENLMNLERVAGGVAMDYRAGRAWKGGAGLVLFGALFALMPAWMLFGDESPGGFTAAIFVGVFGLFAVGLVAGGLWMIGNRLCVRIDAATVESRRFLYGIPVGTRRAPRDPAMRLVACRSGSMSSGSTVTLFYRLAVQWGQGEEIPAGDGFRGYGEVKRAADAVAAYTGLPFQGEVDGRAAFAARKAAHLAARGQKPE